jgi:protein phosphatase
MSAPRVAVPHTLPDDEDIDVHALTHAGNVRTTNQDQYLLATIHRRVQIVATSLSDRQRLPLGDERVAYITMVADGVGGERGGAEASAAALETATEYVVSSMDCYYRSDAREEDFVNALQTAAMQCNAEVLQRASADPTVNRMATTLTLFLAVWPWFYVLQVGDSRYYFHHDGKLTQVTRDQTVAQHLVDQGVYTPAKAQDSRLAHVLSSAIGGEHTEPRVSRIPAMRGLVHLMCSDGLTKHVSDERIAERIASMTSAKQVAEQLLQDALDGGGTDNITIVVGRAKPKPHPA